MAGSREIKCVGPSYTLPDRKTACQRSINLRMRQIEGLGEDKAVVLESAPGLVSVIDFGAQTRGIFSTESRQFVVAGTTLYETTTGAAVARGSISGAGRVAMKDGTFQITIVTGATGYVLTLSSNALNIITDPDWRGSYVVAELNGTFIFLALDQPDQFYLSAIDDATQYDALDFSSSDAQPDSLVTVRVLKQEAFFFGTRSIEAWIYDGGADFPLVRYNATPIDIGIVGRDAVINAADTLVFVGQTERGTGIVYKMIGHQPVRISTAAQESALQAEGVDLSQCSLWVQQGVGGEFVGVNAPGLETTLCWDAATQQWHDLAEMVDGAWAPLRITQVNAFKGGHYAIAGTKLLRMDSSVYTLDGDALVRERTWPHLISPSLEPLSYQSLELECTTGYGGEITLETSNNGGYTFTAPRARSLGAIGRWMEPIRWLWLGSAKDRVYRLRCSDAVPLTIRSANVETHA